MYLHELNFTKNDRIQLTQLYDTLHSHLSKGSQLAPEYFTSLQLSMQTILQQQKGLETFRDELQQHPHKAFHLHLTHKDRSLLNLPWQIAIDNKQYPFVHISKGLPGIYNTEEYLPKAGPLRILVMIASPEDLDHNNRLSYEQEEQSILKVLTPLWETGQVQVDFTADGSLKSLQSQLAVQDYHILYFSGHGMYKDDTGYLMLENDITLETEYVTATVFGEAIKENSPPLIILSSCESAQGFRGIADELMHMGVPAVVAMAFNIIDEYAISFTTHLCEQLANRIPLTAAYTTALSRIRDEEQQQLTGGYQAAQWLVPQYYCCRKITHIVDWKAPGEVLKVAATKFISGEESLLLSQSTAYYFIGRRRENALLFGKLTQHIPVLLRGQGGVGKTALAEHLAKRLISQDPTRYCFAFDETDMGVNGMIVRLRLYLEKHDHLAQIRYELDKHEDVFEQLHLLVEQVSLYCKPVWIFDNMESCQQEIGGPIKDEYQLWMDYVKEKLLSRFPVIFTGRYLIQELPDVIDISLNNVSFVDFYRKCLQLNIREQQGLFKTASLLYLMLGGSYRALEFFDEIYKDDKTRVAEVLRQIRVMQEGTDGLMQQVQEKLANDVKKIVFSALVDVLNERERATLHMLLYFRWPVEEKALNMQLADKNFKPDLIRLKDLTLIEENKGIYYITPLVKDWLYQVKLPPVEFYPEYAGDYFDYIDGREAFFYYSMCTDIVKLNDVGARLVSEYYRKGLYDQVLYYGKKAEEVSGVNTHEEILNNLGLVNLRYDRYDTALTYFTKFLITAKRIGDKKKETTALNSISQVYYQQGKLEMAMTWLEKSRTLAKANDFSEQEAITLTNIGNVYLDRKQFGSALQSFQQSLQLRKASGNLVGQIRVMINISVMYGLQEDQPKVIQTLKKAVPIALEAKDRQQEGYLYTLLGTEYEKQDADDVAMKYFTDALDAGREVGDQEVVGRALNGMGLVYKKKRNFDEAISCLTQSAVILERFGYENISSATLSHLGQIYIERGDHEEGMALLQESLPKEQQS